MKKAISRSSIAERLILAAGILLRLLYVCFSTIYDRQYDIGMISLDAGHTVSGGHLAYIQYLYENLHLPDVDPSTVYQFHHPPVHHTLCALWMRFLSLFIHNNSILEESIQIVPFVFSIITLIFMYKILKEFDIEGKPLYFAMTILSFHPALILLSGSVNNDGTALAFTVLTIYYFIKWIKDSSWKNIILCALFLGLGISTKQNVAYLAFPMALVFIIVLIKTLATGKKMGDATGKDTGNTVGRTIAQYIVFGAVSIPLGMWFFVRNLIKYNMSLLWVYELPSDSWQYTGNVPVINRFLWPDLSEFFDNITHFKIGCGYNVWMQIMRTSVLGEWDMASQGKAVKIVAVLLMLAGAALALVAFILCVRFIVGCLLNKRWSLTGLFMVCAYLVIMAGYLVFAYKYPQECSMNFRYITVTLLFGAVGIGVDDIYENSKIIKSGFSTILAGFCILTIAMLIIWAGLV